MGLLDGNRIRKVQKHHQEEQCYFDAVKQREETLGADGKRAGTGADLRWGEAVCKGVGDPLH